MRTRIAAVPFVCAALAAALFAQVLTDDVVAKQAITSQTHLHFSKALTGIQAFLDEQAAKQCRSVEVHWISFPGTEPRPELEVTEMAAPQQLTVKSVSTDLRTCGLPISPPELPSSKLIVLAVTASGEVRGMQLISAMRDPRGMIVECSVLFGEKPKPNEKCGMFLYPQADLSLRIPSDSEIVKLMVYERRPTKDAPWHLDPIGTVTLAGSSS